MCGRYTLFLEEDKEEIKKILEYLKDHPQKAKMKTGEIFPTNLAPLIMNNKEKQYDILQWGFKFQSLIINARAETIFEKRSFMEPIKNQRCLIPATGFYEWDKNKNKYHFTLEEEQPLYMAGIYRKNHFVIITTKANESIEKIHDRMPVIISENNHQDWLFDNKATLALLNQKEPSLKEHKIN